MPTTNPPDNTVTPDRLAEMRGQIGATSSPWSVEFEPGAIRRYADAIGDPNLAYRDAAYARSLGYADMIAPPVFLGWPAWQGPDRQATGFESVRLDSPLKRHVTGGTEWRYERPILAGERLTAVAELVDVYVKQGRPGVGQMLFQIIDTRYADANGALVVTTRYTDITFQGDIAQEEQHG